MKICYKPTRLSGSRKALVARAESIIDEFAAQGYSLTLRQLYYQFVARDMLPNSDREYKRLGAAVNTGRLAGYLPWNGIEDRTRNLQTVGTWPGPASIVEAAADSYQRDRWETQSHYVEAWVEKDALAGVLERACVPWQVPYFSTRGYPSQSEMWVASQRVGEKIARGKTVTLLHLADHDPSGMDMTRDIEERINLFLSQDWKTGRLRTEYEPRCAVLRLGLNFEQIQEHSPPPNPAKLTDTRAGVYIERYGQQSWELDALEPQTIVGLITGAVRDVLDVTRWESSCELERSERQQLQALSETWEAE